MSTRTMRCRLPFLVAMLAVPALVVPGSAVAGQAATAVGAPSVKTTATTTAKTKEKTFIEKEEMKVFSQCPVSTEEFRDCIYSRTTGGIFEVGTLRVPIKHTIVLQGAIRNPFSGNEELIPALDGETVSPTPQVLPHGILSVLKGNKTWKPYLTECKNFEATNCKVEGAAELVGTGEVYLFNFIGEGTPGVVLPMRLHLTGSILGEHCYFGSAEKPITLDLTTGPTSPEPPNESIHGSTGHLSENLPKESILYDENFELVENAFAAPGAEGCGTGGDEAEIDELVNKKIGLPAPAGDHSTIKLFGEQSLATAANVILARENGEA